jgi:hypothetical protein
MKKRQIIQPILWIERPTGAVMGTGSLWWPIGPSYLVHLPCPACDPNHCYMNLQSHTMDDFMDDFIDLEKLI